MHINVRGASPPARISLTYKSSGGQPMSLCQVLYGSCLQVLLLLPGVARKQCEKFCIFFFGFIFKEIRFEIGFIEEMRTSCDDKEMPQSFFHNSTYLR